MKKRKNPEDRPSFQSGIAIDAMPPALKKELIAMSKMLGMSKESLAALSVMMYRMYKDKV